MHAISVNIYLVTKYVRNSGTLITEYITKLTQNNLKSRKFIKEQKQAFKCSCQTPKFHLILPWDTHTPISETTALVYWRQHDQALMGGLVMDFFESEP